MDTIWIEAMHYETLLKVLGGSEAKAEEAFDQLIATKLVQEPLFRHLDFYEQLTGVDKYTIQKAFDQVHSAFETMQDCMTVLGWESQMWPRQVDSFAYRPRFLYVQGKVDLLRLSSVSVIGTRSPSLEGKRLAFETSCQLGKAGYVVASGLALGIDGVAHKAALANGNPTLAVIGTPLNVCYPPEHEQLQKEIAASNAVVTRFSPATSTQKWYFLLRNRLMSALSEASVVVEDRDGGGAVRQAEFALQQKKYLFIYESSLENKGIHWPRQFANQSRVFTVNQPKDVPRLLHEAKRLKMGIGKTYTRPKAVQLELF